MNKITHPIQPRTRGKKVSDLQDVLLYLLEHRRDLLAPRPVTTHVPRPPDWREIESGLKRERMKSYFGKTTRWLVTNLQYHLDLSSTGLVEEATANAINALLEEWGLLGDGGEEKQRFVVSGRVVNHELRGVDGLRLRVVDKNIGGDRTLAQGKTGERGAYEIRYSPKNISRGKQKPDIQVLALGKEGEILAASAVRYNAGPKERGLDIVIPAEKLPSPPEFPRLQTALTPYLGERGLADLKEDDERQDITYLANKTGWDARMVAMMALAHQFGQEAEVEPEFFYALFRAGIPANQALLARTPPETVRRIWKDAIKKEVLPKAFAAKIDATLERFKRYASDRLLAAPADIGVSGIRPLLEISFLDEAKRKEVAALYYQYQDRLEAFWSAVENKLGEDIASRLQLNGRLAFLTLNNAPLIRSLHEKTETLRDPVDLVRQGFYRQDAWRDLLDEDTPVPDEIPGGKPGEKRVNYAAYMAAQLRLSYPTAVVSQMVKANEMPADSAVKDAVARFLDDHQGRFELGLQPVAQYLRSHDLDLDAPVLREIQRLQRVYQITPSNEAMAALLEHNLDSAYAVVRYDEQHFVRTYQGALGGEARARLVYHKAQQVHNTVLNIVTAYGLERSAPPIYAMPWKPMGGQLEGEAPGVLAYPTLEALFGEMDYCTCEHCRSWLSPAAYLVDLLQFLDTPAPEKGNPLDVLLQRRPDIQHLQLTCENTNTVLPYVDLVNEILEYWVANDSLSDFKGHDMEEGITTEELLASPQFVDDSAYDRLKEELFPSPLPFHRYLEAARRYFARFDTPLYQVMERLRIDDSLERGTNDYAWKDILMERLGLSRQEYAILTDSATPLFQLYGEPTEVGLVENLSGAEDFCRRLNLSYEELIDIVRTGSINPHSRLLPGLEKLHVSFATIQAFLDGTLSEQDFGALLPEDLDEAAYGGDVKQWLRDNAAQIMGIIVLSDPENGDICSFDTVELRYAYPDFEGNRLRPIEFLKLLRFVRLWRKLGWDIEQTDKAIHALYPQDQVPSQEDDWESARTKLDRGFDTLLVRLAHLQAVMEALGLQPNRDLLPLLACWAPIDTDGYDSLYRRMFLSPTILHIDPVFQEDGYGNYLADKREFQAPDAEPPKLADHVEALRAAFNLTQEEFDRILQELDFNDTTVLDLANVSAVFRHGYLARKLRLSVREFLTIKGMSGLDPFAPLDLEEAPADAPFGSAQPQAIRFLALAGQIEDSPFKVSELAYYLKHEDWSGKASPSQRDILAFARSLRADLLRIQETYSVVDDPTGEISKSRMALVYPQEVVDTFFGLLNGRVADESARDFFAQHPELEAPYNHFINSGEPIEERYPALLADILPDLLDRLKRQQMCETLSAKLDVGSALVTLLLENVLVLHAAGQAGEPAISDFLALETQSLDDGAPESFTTTYLRVLKALAIAEALGLSDQELSHFATHEDYRINGEGWLNALPVASLPPADATRRLLRNLLALVEYDHLKEALKVPDLRLLEVLENPETRDEEGILLLQRITGWREDDLTALLNRFGLTLAELGHLHNFLRLKEAFVIVKNLGIGASTLVEVTTNDPDADTLRDLQAALRARYDDQPGPRTPLPPVEEAPARRELPQNRAWLRLIQPINDELRARQRDALITYVLHALSQNSDTEHINTPDKLFEYFLIDVAMDPCMKTSRIKQAISSVQLFIQRCLMNLEPDVASSDVNANEWQWMKRYRVWEANRKVFLWPENWLEPELRDNKSPFFRELESELLQGDITEDAAAKALGHYLEKLDEVGKLEVCAIYYEDEGAPADHVIHVIARTAGARRTYYYHRQEGGITWTPWEKIDLNIEDDPVLPVVWKGRLLLIWVSVLQEAPPETEPADNEASLNLTKVKPSVLRGVAGKPKTRVSLLLYWSEYYNGKWQPARTSDVNHPLSLDEFPATEEDAFDRGKLKLWSVEGEDGELEIMIEYPDRSPVRVLTEYQASVGLTGTTITLWREERVRARYYRLYNTHSLPVTGFDFGVDQEEAKELLTYQGALSCQNTNLVIRKRPILTAALSSCEIVFPHHLVQRALQMPFFFQDHRHVFFVQTEESRVLVARYPDMVIRPADEGVGFEIPRVTIPDYRHPKAGPLPTVGPIQLWEEPEIVRLRTIAEPIAYRLAADGTVRYGSSQIGPAGGIRAFNMDLQ